MLHDIHRLIDSNASLVCIQASGDECGRCGEMHQWKSPGLESSAKLIVDLELLDFRRNPIYTNPHFLCEKHLLSKNFHSKAPHFPFVSGLNLPIGGAGNPSPLGSLAQRGKMLGSNFAAMVGRPISPVHSGQTIS